jgi:hypothetical protein
MLNIKVIYVNDRFNDLRTPFGNAKCRCMNAWPECTAIWCTGSNELNETEIMFVSCRQMLECNKTKIYWVEYEANKPRIIHQQQSSQWHHLHRRATARAELATSATRAAVRTEFLRTLLHVASALVLAGILSHHGRGVRRQRSSRT